MLYRPKFQYVKEGEVQVLALALSQRPWTPKIRDIGGNARVSSGASESYVIREDDLLTLGLRIREDEIANVKAFLRWAREGRGKTFYYYYDQNDLEANAKLVDLDSPQQGTDVIFARADYAKHFDLDITLRSADGSGFNRNFY